MCEQIVWGERTVQIRTDLYTFWHDLSDVITFNISVFFKFFFYFVFGPKHKQTPKAVKWSWMPVRQWAPSATQLSISASTLISSPQVTWWFLLYGLLETNSWEVRNDLFHEHCVKLLSFGSGKLELWRHYHIWFPITSKVNTTKSNDCVCGVEPGVRFPEESADDIQKQKQLLKDAAAFLVSCQVPTLVSDASAPKHPAELSWCVKSVDSNSFCLLL